MLKPLFDHAVPPIQPLPLRDKDAPAWPASQVVRLTGRPIDSASLHRLAPMRARWWLAGWSRATKQAEPEDTTILPLNRAEAHYSRRARRLNSAAERFIKTT